MSKYIRNKKTDGLNKKVSKRIIIENHITHLTRVGSTMDYAWNLFEQGKVENGLVILADHQTSGRGRTGNKWFSNKGEDILCSVLLKLKVSVIPEILMAAALSVVYTIRPYVDDAKITIKWPNDIQIDGNKISGVIAESRFQQSDSLCSVVVGIGLNINLDPNGHDFLPYRTTSMKTLLKRDVDRLSILNLLLNHFDILLQRLSKGESIVNEWKSYLNCVGEEITYSYVGTGKSSKHLKALVENVDSYGRLLLIDKSGYRYCVSAGDIRIMID